MRSFLGFVITPLLALGLGCSTVSSAGVETDQIQATVEVWVDAEGTGAELGPGGLSLRRESISHVEASLYRGGDAVRLDAGDTVTFTADQRGSRALVGSDGYYAFDGRDEHDWTDVIVSFERTSHVSARATRVRVPAPFAFTSAPPQTLSYRSGRIELAWSNAVSGAEVTVSSSDCRGLPTTGVVAFLRRSVADEGVLSISAAELLSDAPPPAGACVRLVLGRAADGTVDPALDPASTIKARRGAGADILIVP